MSTTPEDPHPQRPPVPPAGSPPETAEEWEQVRRSVAMLTPGSWAMRREQSLHALGTLVGALRGRTAPANDE